MLKIEKVPLSEIREYKKNAKIHTQEQIDAIAKSIKEFGFNDPIAIDENGVIIEGHGRYRALEQLGKKYAPCIRLTGMTKEQKKAYILAHNKLNMDTGFDIDVLRQELQSIQKSDVDLSFLEFDSSLLSDVLDISNEDFIQGNEYVKKKFTIKIECKNEEQMEKRKAKLRKAGWI